MGKFSDGKKDRLIDGKKDRLIDGGETWMDGQTDGWRDRQADRQMDRQTGVISQDIFQLMLSIQKCTNEVKREQARVPAFYTTQPKGKSFCKHGRVKMIFK